MTQVDLIKINLDEKLNMLPSSEVKLPTATLHLLQGIEQEGKRLHFKADCGLFMVNLLGKLQERSPLKYQLMSPLA